MREDLEVAAAARRTRPPHTPDYAFYLAEIFCVERQYEARLSQILAAQENAFGFLYHLCLNEAVGIRAW